MLEMPLMKRTGWSALWHRFILTDVGNFWTCCCCCSINYRKSQLIKVQFLHPVGVHEEFLIRTTILDCLSTSQPELHQKHIKMFFFDERKEVQEIVKEEAKEISRQDRLFPIPSFLDFISRFSLSRHPLAPVVVFQPLFALILKQKSLLFLKF